MISRDINFDESTVGFPHSRSSEEVEDDAMDFDLIEINKEEVHQKTYKQTGKRKSQGYNRMPRSSCHWNGLEEESAPDRDHDRCSRHQTDDDETFMDDGEEKQADFDDSTPPRF